MAGKWSPFVREAVDKAQRLDRDRVARMSEEAQERHADEMAWREAEARAEADRDA